MNEPQGLPQEQQAMPNEGVPEIVSQQPEPSLTIDEAVGRNTAEIEQKAAADLARLGLDEGPETPETIEVPGDETPPSEEQSTADETQDAPVEEPVAQGEEETFDFGSLEEIAEAAEIPLDDFLALTHTFKSAGEEKTVPVQELIKRYQMGDDYTQKTQELAKKREEATSAFNNFHIATDQERFMQLEGFSRLRQATKDQREGEAMRKLREDDPGEWAAQVEELNQREREVDASIQGAERAYVEKLQKGHQDYILLQMQALNELGYDPQGPEVLKARERLQQKGFQDGTMFYPGDARLVKMEIELDQLRGEVSKTKQARKGVEEFKAKFKRKVKKSEKPGAKTQEQPEQQSAPPAGTAKAIASQVERDLQRLGIDV